MNAIVADPKALYTSECFIPQTLPNDLLTLDKDFALHRGAQLRVGDFCLSTFVSRYLAGNTCLSGSREVSRKRLVLQQVISNNDDEAKQLNEQINRYQQAKRKLQSCTIITLQDLCQVNRLLTPERSFSGQIRTSQTWVGNKNKAKANYIPPPPNDVKRLMANLLEFINGDHGTAPERAFAGYIQLLIIHPFDDGNGRTARLLLEVMLQQWDPSAVNPVILRLKDKGLPYLAAIGAFGMHNNKGLSQRFWCDYRDWQVSFYQDIKAIYAASKKQLAGLVAMCPLDTIDKQLLDYLWHQPIVTQALLAAKFKWPLNACNHSINKMVSFGVLKVRHLREPMGAIIYDCPTVFAAWSQFDELITDRQWVNRRENRA